MEYYKKIDKSFFKYGITIPKDFEAAFRNGKEIPFGGSTEIIIKFKNKKYIEKLCYVNRTNASSVFQLRWDGDNDLLRELKSEFIQSYFAIQSADQTAKENDEYYVTNLLGGNQEVVIFDIKKEYIELKTFIKITTPYDKIFKQLVESNVFGWLSKIDVTQLITKRSKWLDIKDLKKHENINFVVYYLIDEKNKELYIGSAKTLGDRVKAGRHEIPGWNKFYYEIIHPNYHNLLREIEYHSIMSFARFFENNGKLSTINISEYKLVNKDYKFYTQ